MFVAKDKNYFYLYHSFWDKEKKKHKKKKFYLGKYPIVKPRLYKRIIKEYGESVKFPPESLHHVKFIAEDKANKNSNRIVNRAIDLSLALETDQINDWELNYIIRQLLWTQENIQEFVRKKTRPIELKPIGQH